MTATWLRRAGDQWREDPSGAGLVAAQVLALAALGRPRSARGTPWPLQLAGGAAVAAGTVVLTGGLRELGSALSPFPTPVAGEPLRTGGAYAVVRHPMYAGFLLAGGGVVLARPRRETLSWYALLAVVLHLKSRREDAQLRRVHGEAWDAWAREVPALVPLARW